MNAAREHTDGVNATGETTKIVKTVGRVEQALNAIGYVEPVLAVEALNARIRRQMLTTLSLYRSLSRVDLIRITKSHPGCDWQEMGALPNAVIDMLIFEGRISQNPDDVLTYIERPEEIPQSFLEKADALKKANKEKPTLIDRLAQFFARILHKIWGGLILLIATSSLAFGLSL
jgi:hypothetical protein